MKTKLERDLAAEFQQLEDYRELLQLRISDISRDEVFWARKPNGQVVQVRRIKVKSGKTIHVELDEMRPGNEDTHLRTRHVHPPINAEFLLHLLLRRDEQDALIGDLIERYSQKHDRLGERRANLWFYSEVIRSVWPLLGRAVAKVSGLVAVGEWIRKHIS